MNKREIIERLKNITRHAVHNVGEKPFVMSVDDGIAVHEAVELLKKPETNCSEFPNNWIPCSERLPEEDTEVLISYRYKEGEGDTDHVNIDITSYGTTCFGGREIHTLKEWRQPFDYFHANYEVIAWMPLPEPYKGEQE